MSGGEGGAGVKDPDSRTPELARLGLCTRPKLSHETMSNELELPYGPSNSPGIMYLPFFMFSLYPLHCQHLVIVEKFAAL